MVPAFAGTTSSFWRGLQNFRQPDLYHFHARAIYQRFRCDRPKSRSRLRVARAHRRLTPSQPKFDTNRKDRIATNARSIGSLSKRCVACVSLSMSVLRNRPKGARFAFFGFGLCVFALIPNETGYQDIASLLARQPGVAERWQKRVFSSALASIQVATFSFGRPIGTSSQASATFRLASIHRQGIDVTGSVTRSPLLQQSSRYRASDFPKVNRALKGDRLAAARPETAAPAEAAP